MITSSTHSVVVVSLLFGTGIPPSRDINSHNSHSTAFQIGDYDCVSCSELMSWVVCSVSNKSEWNHNTSYPTDPIPTASSRFHSKILFQRKTVSPISSKASWYNFWATLALHRVSDVHRPMQENSRLLLPLRKFTGILLGENKSQKLLSRCTLLIWRQKLQA